MTMTNQGHREARDFLPRQDLRFDAAQGRLGAGPLRVETTDDACRVCRDDRQRQDGVVPVAAGRGGEFDGIAVIAIDPKGDIGNLLLSFPELRG